MGDGDAAPTAEAGWLHPETQDGDWRRYAAILRLHRRLIVTCVLIGAAAAVLYVNTATPVYKAETDLFVSPVSSVDTSTLALGLVTASNNPTGDVQTAARLASSIDAARSVKNTLKLPGSPQEILHKVTAQPVAQSNIVALTAEAGSARSAATLANTFANAVIAQRTAQYRALIGNEIASLNTQLAGLRAGSAEAGVLRAQLARLTSFQASPLPDMRISTLAVPPNSRSSPRTATTIVGGTIAGLALGLALAFGLELLDVRVRRVQQLLGVFRIPVLALIPREGRARGPLGELAARLPIISTVAEARRIRRAVPRTPDELSPNAREAYRTLRATLLALRPRARTSRSILVTSASAGEGKTTTAINLADSLASSGAGVILLEADLRRPSIANALDLGSFHHDMGSVLNGNVPLSRALVDSPSHGPGLRMLLARADDEPNPHIGDALLLPSARSMLEQAKELADFVIVDAPPLAEVIDALELARTVDDVLLVVMLNQTRLPKLLDLGELLARTDVTPIGFAMVSVEPPKGLGYGYGYGPYTSEPAVATKPKGVAQGRDVG